MTDIEEFIPPKPLNFIDNPDAITALIDEMLKVNINTVAEMRTFLKKMRQTKKFYFPNTKILYMYRVLCQNKKYKYDKKYEALLRSKKNRSLSGVIVIAVFTSPYPKNGDKIEKFSCEYDCHYCPNEPDQPRSYLLKEPGVQRANRNGFDCVRQFTDRANAYIVNGHPVDKIELLVLGGTWSSYPSDYQEEFIRDIYYSANTFYDKDKKTTPQERRSLEYERDFNETAKCKIIGLTLETRPDRINKRELIRFRRFGVTRVQIGIQHTNDRILQRINRGCNNADAIKAIKLLKDSGFKIDIHLMPDLPRPLKEGIDPNKTQFTIDDIDTEVDMSEWDRAMFMEVITNPDLQADQWKIYPCETVPWTRIKDEFDRGVYRPYGSPSAKLESGNEGTQLRGETNKLFELLIDVKTLVPEWIRLNRVIRDIPTTYITGGVKCSNMRQFLQEEMTKRNLRCKCIRCREVKNRKVNFNDTVLVERVYEASGGTEYFLSFENKDKKILLGFLRLRLTPNAGMGNGRAIFKELKNAALIRELHVYGQVVKVGDTNAKTQHLGFGKRLMKRAEEIAFKNGYKKIAVISGEGVKGYYKKQGYKTKKFYMLKKLKAPLLYYKSILWLIITLVILYLMFGSSN
jgi:ELP3 family radical SAM enzyme/protein acetyltransferase